MRALLLFLLVFFTSPVLAQSNSEPASEHGVKIRAYLEPEGDVYVGQLVRLWVEISSASQFDKAPRYPDLKLDGAIALMPDQFGVNFTDNARSGQRQRYVIIPQRDGTFAIPPIKVTLGLLVDGKPTGPIAVQTEPVELIAKFPPAMKEFGQVVTTEELQVTENYDHKTDNLMVGDAITRTVTLHGKDTFALALPATEFAEVKGTRLYPAQSKLSDKTNRGQYSGTRIDAATYVLEKATKVVLPEIVVRWWNPQSKTVEETTLPKVDFSVAPNPDFKNPASAVIEEQSLSQSIKRIVLESLVWLRSNIAWLTLAAIGCYVFLLLWRRFVPVLIEHWKNWRSRVLASEAHYFKEFRHACRQDDAAEISRTFWRWIDSQSLENEALTLQMAGLRNRDDKLSDYLEQQERQYYGGGTEKPNKIDGRAFYRKIKELRKAVLIRQSAQPTDNHTRLNPSRI